MSVAAGPLLAAEGISEKRVSDRDDRETDVGKGWKGHRSDINWHPPPPSRQLTQHIFTFQE